MSCSVNCRRIIAALVFALALIAVYERFPERTGLAGPKAAREPFLAAKYRGQDAVTDAIRSDSTVLTRIPVRNDEERRSAARVGRVIEDYGTFVLVGRSAAKDAKEHGLAEETVETTVNLPGSQFDPVRQPPQGSLRLGTSSATAFRGGYYVLQFGATPTDAWLNSLGDAGVEVLQYVSHQAYFVYGEPAAIARAADHSRVRWIGQYTPDQKLTPVFRNQLSAAANRTDLARGTSPIELTGKQTAIFDVAVFARADLKATASELRRAFGRGYFRVSRLQHNFFNVVRLEIALEDVEKAAALDDVFSIEPVVASRNEDARSAQILAGNYINQTTLSATTYDPFTQFGADGTNVTVSVVDDGVGIPGEGGFYIHSLNTANGPLRSAPAGAIGHGHLNASIIAGSALPSAPLDSGFFNFGIGVAPRAHILNIPRNRLGYTGDDAEVYNDSVITPGPNGAPAFISNNSWGSGLGNTYTSLEAQYDGYVMDASSDSGVDPITLIFSAGNLGTEGLTRPKAAKNVITVGNSEGLRSELGAGNANNMDDLAGDSSRGPAADGRIKPDVVAPGTAITGGRSGTDTLKGNIDAFHRWSNGTSHSAAQVSGIAALFSSWYGPNFGFRPMPSLIKAALINSAVNLNGENTSAAIPNGNEGWGRPNLKNMLRTGVGMKYINEELTLDSTGQGFELNGSVADSTKPLRVTLVWTDPPGTADPALVNNLDLVVTVGGTTYKGNVFSNGLSIAGGTADNRNNVESVFLPAGIPVGTGLSVQVNATALNGDGVLNNGDFTDSKYSLVVYNWSGLQGTTSHQLAGRVISANGRGIGQARIRLTDTQGVVREARSNPLGYFSFASVPGGQTYAVTISAKRYAFAQQNLTVAGNMTNLSFQANQGAP